MMVPIWDSSLVTYSATCSSLKPRSRVSFNFLMSSEARSTGGTVTSVTRNTIQSPPPAPGACAAESFGERKAASITLVGTPGTGASVRNPRDRLAVRRAAGTVDGVDGDSGEAKFLGGLDDAGAAATLVLHLVVKACDLGAGALGSDLTLQLGRDAFVSGLGARLDLADP